MPSSSWVEEIAAEDQNSNNADVAVPHAEESQMRVATLTMYATNFLSFSFSFRYGTSNSSKLLVQPFVDHGYVCNL